MTRDDYALFTSHRRRRRRCCISSSAFSASFAYASEANEYTQTHTHTHRHQHLLATTANNLPHNGSSSCQQRFNCSKLKATIHKRPLTGAVNVAVSVAVDVSHPSLSSSHSSSLYLSRIARDKSQCLHLRVGFPLIAQVWVMSPLSPTLSFCSFPLPHPTAFRVMPDSGSSACSYLRHRPLCSSCPLHAGVCFLLARALCPLHAHRAACGSFEGVRGGHWGCLWAISRQKFHELISVLHVVIY